MMNSKYTITLLLLICIFKVLAAYAVPVTSLTLFDAGDWQQINRVDNSKGIVVINDVQYRFKLNTKVYGPNKRELNRYALKKNQNVIFRSSDVNNVLYVDTLYIQKL